jgi:single-strand DNA-binding protein
LIGRIGKDPELRTTASGTSVVGVSLATTESFKGKDGNRQDKTDWHNLQIWGKSAETFSEWVKKGDRICVMGRVSYRQWDDRDGNKRNQTDIVVEKFEFLQDKKDGGGNGGRNNSSPPQRDRNQPDPSPPMPSEDEYNF